MKFKRLLSTAVSTTMLLSALSGFTFAKADDNGLVFKLDFDNYAISEVDGNPMGIVDSVTNSPVNYMGGTVEKDSMVNAKGTRTPYLNMWGTLMADDLSVLGNERDITISLWAKVHPSNGGWQRQMRVTKNPSVNDESETIMELDLIADESKVSWRAGRNKFNDGFLEKEARGLDFSTEKWTNIVLTREIHTDSIDFDWYNWEVYVDGELKTDMNGTGGLLFESFADAKMLIGATTSGNAGAIREKLGSFEIYNSRMNAASVKTLYDNQVADFTEIDANQFAVSSVSQTSLNKKGGSFSINFTNVPNSAVLNDFIVLKDASDNIIPTNATPDADNALKVNVQYGRISSSSVTLSVNNGITSENGVAMTDNYSNNLTVEDMDVISELDLTDIEAGTVYTSNTQISGLSAYVASGKGSVTVKEENGEKYLELNSLGDNTFISDELGGIELDNRALVFDFEVKSNTGLQTNVGLINDRTHGTLLFHDDNSQVDTEKTVNCNGLTYLGYFKNISGNTYDYQSFRYVLAKDGDTVYGYIYDNHEPTREPYKFTSTITDMKSIQWFTPLKMWFNETDGENKFTYLKNYKSYYADITSVVGAEQADAHTVNVSFNEELNSETANITTNYRVNNVIPEGASYDAASKTVSLYMTAPFTEKNTYSIACNGVKDINDEYVMCNTSFTANEVSPEITVDFMDNNDIIITGDSITAATAVKADVKTKLDESSVEKTLSGKAVLAVYENDVCVAVNSGDVSITAGQPNNTELVCGGLDESKTYTTKVFVWNNLENMVPIFPSVMPKAN